MGMLKMKVKGMKVYGTSGKSRPFSHLSLAECKKEKAKALAENNASRVMALNDEMIMRELIDGGADFV